MSNYRPLAAAAAVACIPLALGLQALTRSAPSAPLMSAAQTGPDVERVVRVLDGDTFEVRRGDAVSTVRLLDVDAPDAATDGRDAQCGAEAAKAFLEKRLPVGTPVSIRFSDLQFDWYQRELGWVTTPDRKVVNVDVVAAGMGAAWQQQPDAEFLEPLRAAHRSAAQAGTGLHRRSSCSFAARVDEAVTELTDGTRRAKLIAEVDYERAMRTLGRSYDETTALQQDLIGADSTAEGRLLGTAAVQRLRVKLGKALDGARAAEERIVDAEEARIAAELAAAEARERRRQAEAARRAEKAKTATPQPGPTSTAGTPGTPPPGAPTAPGKSAPPQAPGKGAAPKPAPPAHATPKPKPHPKTTPPPRH